MVNSIVVVVVVVVVRDFVDKNVCKVNSKEG